MIREAISIVEMSSSIGFHLKQLGSGLELISKKTKYSKEFKALQKDLDKMVVNFEEGFLSKIKKFLSGYEITKTSDIKDDMKYVNDMVFKDASIGAGSRRLHRRIFRLS